MALRTVKKLLWLSPLFLVTACEPSSTGVTEGTPTPVPVGEAQADYRLTMLMVSDDEDTSLDIDGDGKEDNALPDALDEVADVTVDLIEPILEQLLPDETEKLVIQTVNQIIHQYISVDTINTSLQAAVEFDIWLQRTMPNGGGGVIQEEENVIVEYWYGYQEVGNAFYYTWDQQGTLSGNYDDPTDRIDVSGTPVKMKMVFIGDGSNYELAFDLNNCRTVNSFDTDELEEAMLAGAIPITAIEQLIDYVLLAVASYTPIPAETLEALSETITELLDEVADTTDSAGEPAISASFVYNAVAADVQSYY